jgi:muramoyltetrapeptide carboxypeptidase
VSLTRRTLVTAAAGAPLLSLAGSSRAKPVKKPKMLKPGDTLALIAPASAADSQQAIDAARQGLQAIGFNLKPEPHILDYWGYLGGTDQHRADDVNSAFADPTVNGIMCLQGGYGAGRILPLLDYDLIRKNPKPLLGYSDITALHLAIYARAGIVTFHGPLALSTFQGLEGDVFRRVVQTPTAAGLLGIPDKPSGHPPDPGAATLIPGAAQGKLAGGNLSLVSSLVGSPYLPSFEGHIVFLEDIGEEPYRIDRMLNTLWISGAMKGVRGVMFGDFSARAEKPFSAATDPSRAFTMQQVLQNFANQVNVPTYCGAWFGHIRDKYTLPLGIEAKLDADKQTLEIVEPAVTQ